ncbi:MAG: hypothetical protein ABIF82_14500 [Planctomycetota bacterium]
MSKAGEHFREAWRRMFGDVAIHFLAIVGVLSVVFVGRFYGSRAAGAGWLKVFPGR